MKTILCKLFATAVVAGSLAVPVAAQTFTWNDIANGQVIEICDHNGTFITNYWPNNNNWSQAAHHSPDCSGLSQIEDQPSNWTNAPADGLYPGGPGLTGVDVVLGAPADTFLDVPVIVNNLTVLPSGSLTVSPGGGATANHVDFQSDGVIRGVFGGGGGAYINIPSGGTLTKSGGTGLTAFGANDDPHDYVGLLTLGASVIVKTGTLAFPYNDTAFFADTSFCVSNNATLVLVPMGSPSEPTFAGTITGVGTGTVRFDGGEINDGGPDFNGTSHLGARLNFPGAMFQWTAGIFGGGNTLTNVGVLNITNNGASIQTTFYNDGLINLAANSSFGVAGNVYGYNQPDGIINIQGDSSLTGNSPLVNYGLVKKTAGTGTSQILQQFQDYGGTLEVDSGTVALNLQGGGILTNAVFDVHSGATVDLSISNLTTEIEGTLTAIDGGTVLVNNGTLNSLNGATLNFPAAMFQWAGGTMQGPSLVNGITNQGTVNLVGPGVITRAFYNNGTFIQTNGGTFSQGAFYNDVGATYQIKNDNWIFPGQFFNYGLLEKTAGTGTNFIVDNPFYNYGSIVADTGALVISNSFYQEGGVFTLASNLLFGANAPTFDVDGGTVTGIGTFGAPGDYVVINGGNLSPGNPFGTVTALERLGVGAGGSLNFSIGGANQFSQIAIGGLGYFYAGGTLNVSLTNDYNPPVGTQFQIISSTAVFDTFATTNIPPGFSLSFSNSGIYVTFTGATPPHIISPQLAGANFEFSFGTVPNQSYSVYSTTNLATTNWTFYTNLTGDGTLQQIVVPVRNPPVRFFRVTSP